MVLDDVDDEILKELRAIRRGVGDIDSQDGTPTEQAVWQGLRTFNAGDWQIDETADLDEANTDGSITLQPGEQKTIAEARDQAAQALGLLSVGATDATDVTYFIRIDSTHVVGGRTNSPLGSVNDPFSFPQYYTAVVPAENRIEYVAKLDGSAAGSVDLVSRLTTQVV